MNLRRMPKPQLKKVNLNPHQAVLKLPTSQKSAKRGLRNLLPLCKIRKTSSVKDEEKRSFNDHKVGAKVLKKVNRQEGHIKHNKNNSNNNSHNRTLGFFNKTPNQTS